MTTKVDISKLYGDDILVVGSTRSAVLKIIHSFEISLVQNLLVKIMYGCKYDIGLDVGVCRCCYGCQCTSINAYMCLC